MIIFLTERGLCDPSDRHVSYGQQPQDTERNDDKFYMLTINPSGEEQQHLIEK